jgi:hypothetical protein
MAEMIARHRLAAQAVALNRVRHDQDRIALGIFGFSGMLRPRLLSHGQPKYVESRVQFFVGKGAEVIFLSLADLSSSRLRMSLMSFDASKP